MDRLDLLGDPALRETLLLLRRSPGPLSADDAAAELGVHRNVARARLERLAAGGLLAASFERRSGRAGPGAGRPAKVYVPAPELEAVEFPPGRYRSLSAALAAELPPSKRGRVAAAFARDFDVSGGGSLPSAAARRVCAALGRRGYQARVVSANADELVISTPTCPLRPLVRDMPETAALDREFWAELTRRALGSRRALDVDCTTHSCLEDDADCSVTLRLRPSR